jgi:hypothetical protein
MKCKSRRFEVLLPVRFNDGRDVPNETLGEAVNDLSNNSVQSPRISRPLRAVGDTKKRFFATTSPCLWWMSPIRPKTKSG